MARSRSIGTKLTPEEEQQILEAAEVQGKAPSEWARDLLLRGAVASNRGEMEMHIFTELVGIQMLDERARSTSTGREDDPGTTRPALPPSPDNEGRASARTPSKAQSEQGEMTR